MAYVKRGYHGKSDGQSGFSKNRGGFGGRPARRRGLRKENIHPSKFIKSACSVDQPEYVSKHTFEDFDIPQFLKKNIAKQGITTPSPIQDQSIPEGLAGKDILGIANTGTGKTISFAIPILAKMWDDKNAKTLIMAPTRELAQQILEEFKMLTLDLQMNWALLIGGAPMNPQFRDLYRKPRIVIGTPGRIKDHMKQRSLDLSSFNVVVLDEVDRMLDMGFVNDMRDILGKMAEKRQSFFFSATMSPKVRSLINEFSKDPVTVSVKTGNTSDNVEQNIVKYRTHEDKLEKLHNLLIENQDCKVLIFDETKRSVDKLSDSLRERGFKADATHGNKTLGQRKRVLAEFKVGAISILVATDVAARGIDVKDVTHVINYSTPQCYDDYVHRIGRTGRAGKTGFALTFIQG